MNRTLLGSLVLVAGFALTGCSSSGGGTTDTSSNVDQVSDQVTETCNHDGTCDSHESVADCPSDCVQAPVCGDGVLGSGEECDDGNLDNGDGCESDCTTSPVCGDGTVDVGESCDDGNAVDGDGCEADCTLSPDVPSVCGNGVIEGSEACDDGNNIDKDGCFHCALTPLCGNRVVEGTEECDDGNDVDGDGCYRCTLTPLCGDGIVMGREECDDGNLVDGDSCSSQCLMVALTCPAGTTCDMEGPVGGMGNCLANGQFPADSVRDCFGGDPCPDASFDCTVVNGTSYCIQACWL